MKKYILLLVSILGFYNLSFAREVITVNDNWRFYFSSENSADYARTISLPHTWAYESTNALVSTQPTTANYTREIYAPTEWSQKRLFIKFYGVESVADVLVNGRYVGEHRGGSTAFVFELTPNIKFGQTNRIHVIVNNAPQSNVLPTSHEEDRYGGIYRDVELIVTDQLAVSPLYYGSSGVFVSSDEVAEDEVSGEVNVHLTSTKGGNCQLSLSIFDPEGAIVFQKSLPKVKIGADAVEVPFTIESARLWSPSEPNLYKFIVNVADGTSTDVVEVTSGFRSIEFSEAGAIKINGEPTCFRGVSLYHDYPHVGGAASARDIEADVELIEELGANAIRSVTHPHHPYLYDLCDATGKLVWIDFPLTKAPFLSDIAYYPTASFHEGGRQILSEIILQNYNHPSVVMWGLFSLLSTRGDNAIPYIKELNQLAKTLDPYRATVAVSDQDGAINSITDLIVWKQTLGWDKGLFSDVDLWSDLLHENWSNMRSGVSYGQSGRFDQQSQPTGYKTTNVYRSSTWNPEGRQREFHEEYARRIGVDSLFWGVCLNSMFDFKSSRNPLGENNSGLMTFDRRNRKDIFYLYKSQWNKEESTLHIADSRNSVSSSRKHKVRVYASDSLPHLMLYTAKDTVQLQQVAPWQFEVEDIILDPGVNKFVVRQGELADSVTVVLQQSSALR